MYRKTYLKVDVDNFIKNSDIYVKHTGKKMMGIVKADAYGVGDYPMAQYLEKHGVDFFGVSSLEESLRLRKHGIKSEILILSYIHDIDTCKKNNLSVIVPNRMFIDEHKNNLEGLKVHIKINTGLNRLGIKPSELNDVIKDLTNYKADIEGVMTHFACSESEEITNKHFALFKEAVINSGFKFNYIHTSATDAAIYLKDDISNYIRIGLGLLGSSDFGDKFPLYNVPSLYAEIIDCKQIPAGEGVSYQHNQ